MFSKHLVEPTHGTKWGVWTDGILILLFFFFAALLRSELLNVYILCVPKIFGTEIYLL